MEIATFLVTTFVIGLSGALMPGPVTFVTIAHAVKRGHSAGPLVSLGHGIVEGSLVVALALGLSQVLRLPLVTGIVGLAGGLSLLYMGFGMIRAPAPADVASGGGIALGGMGPVAAGMLTSLSSPYWFLWWATAGASQLLIALVWGPVGVVIFYLSHFMADLGWLSAVGSAVAAGRKLLTPRIYKGILGACGVFLLGLGAYFLYSGATTLRQM